MCRIRFGFSWPQTRLQAAAPVAATPECVVQLRCGSGTGNAVLLTSAKPRCDVGKLRSARRHPVRWARPPSLSTVASATPQLPAKAAGVAHSPVGCAAATLPGLSHASGRPQLMGSGRLPMSSCACALKVSHLNSSVVEHCLGPAEAPYRPPTSLGVLRDILRRVRSPQLATRLHSLQPPPPLTRTASPNTAFSARPSTTNLPHDRRGRSRCRSP
jgi:hypothetical protein